MGITIKHQPELKNISIDKLIRGKYQPRRNFQEEELQELAESIQSAGLIQPIVVRPLQDGHYEIVAGERRWRAAQLAGITTLPCLINHYTDEQTAAVSTIENINRVDLNPIEEARAYQRFIDEFDYLHEEIAAIVGKSRTKISNTLRLLKLDDRVQSFLIEGDLSEGHGKILAGVAKKLQFPLAEKSIKQDWSVRKIENEAKKLSGELEKIDMRDPNIKALERSLGEHIGCKVSIDFDTSKCKLLIDCHNLDIFQGVLEKMGFKMN